MSDELQHAFEHWQKMFELQSEFLAALGEYKLRAAKAAVAQAVAEQQWAVARMKAAVASDLEATLKRLKRQRHCTHHTAHRLRRHAQAAAKIRSGEDLRFTSLSLMWGAYTVFERLAPAKVIEQLSKRPLEDSARRGESYADPRRPHRTCPDPPANVKNVLALISWLKKQQFVPRRGTAAYRQVVAAFAAIANVAQQQIAVLQNALKSLEQNTYDTWQPVVIAALPDNTDVRKVISLGAK
jgi:hypothetical protein